MLLNTQSEWLDSLGKPSGTCFSFILLHNNQLEKTIVQKKSSSQRNQLKYGWISHKNQHSTNNTITTPYQQPNINLITTIKWIFIFDVSIII